MSICLATDSLCTSCGVHKPLSAFYKESRVKSGVTARCKDCTKSAAGQSYQRRADEVKARMKASYSSEGSWASKLWRNYRLTTDDYQRMAEEQGHVCKCCGSAVNGTKQHNRWLVDHCHMTNKVRGLVCLQCNIMLGHSQDDPVRLRAGALYLETHG